LARDIDRKEDHAMSRRLLVIGLASVIAAAGGLASAATHGSRPTAPAIDPHDFVRHVTNQFFPLKPGTLLVYRGVKDGKVQIDRTFVTRYTKTILGVHATVVRDVATDRTRVLEKTFDWYAQDRAGNVWYLGEDTKSFEPDGTVSTEGSWETGVDGAVPGIVMEADPHTADGYRQEFFKGHAEDQAWILRRGVTIHVPYGTLHHGLRTMEWTPLEPVVIDRKAYAKGIGLVSEVSATGARETAELIRARFPS